METKIADIKLNLDRYADDNALVRDIMFRCQVSRTRAWDIAKRLLNREPRVERIVLTCYAR